MSARTLVVHTGALGDFLLACPAIARIDGPVTLLGHPEPHSLAVEAGIAGAAKSLDQVDFHTLFSEPSERLRGFLAEFDRAIVWMRDDDGLIRKRLTACGVRKVDTFPGLPDADWATHASGYYLGCLGFEPREDFRLNIAGHSHRHDLIFHPGSGSPKKNWPLERYLALAQRLEKSGRRVTWSLGPAERETTRAFESVPAQQRLEAGSLRELAAVLATARGYVGNDSGITHLAAIVGCPTVALFGPTDPAVWGPRGKNATVLHGHPWPALEEVAAEVARA